MQTPNLFNASAPSPVCVTAFLAPQSLLKLVYSDSDSVDDSASVLISVGTYMSDRSISKICNFTNAANALNYAFILKEDKCPISKKAFALLLAEIKRTGAVSSRALARRKANVSTQDKSQIADVEIEKPKTLYVKDSAVPLLKQYKAMKKKHPDAVLLFRVGDFYECFEDDAKVASDVLGISLTSRANGKKKAFLAGFPHHALDTYLPKLVRAGHRVAICEQS